VRLRRGELVLDDLLDDPFVVAISASFTTVLAATFCISGG